MMTIIIGKDYFGQILKLKGSKGIYMNASSMSILQTMMPKWIKEVREREREIGKERGI